MGYQDKPQSVDLLAQRSNNSLEVCVRSAEEQQAYFDMESELGIVANEEFQHGPVHHLYKHAR